MATRLENNMTTQELQDEKIMDDTREERATDREREERLWQDHVKNFNAAEDARWAAIFAKEQLEKDAHAKAYQPIADSIAAYRAAHPQPIID